MTDFLQRRNIGWSAADKDSSSLLNCLSWHYILLGKDNDPYLEREAHLGLARLHLKLLRSSDRRTSSNSRHPHVLNRKLVLTRQLSTPISIYVPTTPKSHIPAYKNIYHELDQLCREDVCIWAGTDSIDIILYKRHIEYRSILRAMAYLNICLIGERAWMLITAVRT